MANQLTIHTNQKPAPAPFFRWLVLFFISMAMFGNYYIYDSISPLADLLKSQLGFSDGNIGWLNAIYSFPNIIMVLIGGILIDKIGTRRSVFIFAVLVMIGSMVTVLKGNFYIMIIGRFIYGLGAESMIVAITTIVARWFKGKELSFAFGLNLTVARLGSFMALNSPTWAKHLYYTWQKPLSITVIAGISAVTFILIYYLVDKYAVTRYDIPKDGQQEKIELREIFKFGASFWFITALCVTFYSAMFPFQTFAIKFFQEVHHTTREVGGNLSSMLTLAAMIFTPLFGLLVDRIGRRATLMMFGSLLIIPVYLVMAYKVDLAAPLGIHGAISINLDFFDIHSNIPIYLLIPMSMMGIAFSLIPAIMWPSVALITDKSKLGTAYGLMTMIQNIGLFSFNLLIGTVNDITGGYTTGMWIFSTLGFAGITFAYLLKKSDARTNEGKLEFSKAS